MQTDSFSAAEGSLYRQRKSSLLNSLLCGVGSDGMVALRIGVAVNSTVHDWELHGSASSSRTVTLLGAAVLRMLAGTKSVT